MITLEALENTVKELLNISRTTGAHKQHLVYTQRGKMYSCNLDSMVPHKLYKMTILVSMPMLMREILQVLLLDEKLKVINDY